MTTQTALPDQVLAGDPAPPVAPAPSAEPPAVRIRAPRGWLLVDVGELWRFRELIYFLMWRDVKVRYKQTVLGAAWAVLQPLMMMAVFTVFFGRMAGLPSDGLPYPLFAFAGLLPWTFFATAVSSAGNSVVAAERLVSKVYFPRLAIPIAATGAAAVDFLIAFGMLGVLMAYYGVAPGLGLLLAPLFFAVIFLAALGIGTILAALNVAYRDFRYVIPFLVQFGMFATPTVYMQPSGDSGGAFHALLELNPMTGLIAAFRAACLGGEIPWEQAGASAACIALVLVGGCFYFRRAEQNFADII